MKFFNQVFRPVSSDQDQNPSRYKESIKKYTRAGVKLYLSKMEEELPPKNKRSSLQGQSGTIFPFLCWMSKMSETVTGVFRKLV